MLRQPSVQIAVGDTLILVTQVTGVPDGETITIGRLAVGTFFTADHFDITGSDVTFTIPSSTTSAWSPGRYRLEVKVALSDDRVAQIIRGRIVVVDTQITSMTP